MLAWGQLEADIDEACREAIRHGRASDDWRYRRAWTLYNPDDRRLSGLSFESRLTLVLEKGSAGWKRIMQLYSVRNQIAHGSLLSDRIDVPSVIRGVSWPSGFADAGLNSRELSGRCVVSVRFREEGPARAISESCSAMTLFRLR